MKKPYVCLLVYHVYTCIAAYSFSRIVFSQPPLFKYIFFINNCIYRRCHLHLRKTLIFKSFLLIYSLLKLSLLTRRPTDLLLILILLLLLLPVIIPLYCRTSVHALFVRYTRLPLVITTRFVYILVICFRCVMLTATTL